MEKYKDLGLSPEERARDLVSRLTPAQKTGQLLCKMFTENSAQMLQDCPAGVGEALIALRAESPASLAETARAIIDRIMEKTGGIPPVIHAEALSGMLGPGATSFPSAIGLAAAFDTDALEKMTDIIRQQMLAVGIRRAMSPVMDVARDPRWGRMGETYGEDATLAAAMSVAFVKGLQGEDLTQGAAATGKHFLGYAMGEGGLNSGSNAIPFRDLREVYAKPFQAAITRANLQGVMNSYGTVDNEAVIGSKAIFKTLLRGEMQFKGVTVSDYGSIDLLEQKRVAESKAQAAVSAFNAGMEIECPNPSAYLYLPEALAQGSITVEQVDAAVCNALAAKFRLGLFENPYPRVEWLEQAYQDPDHAAHSLALARKSVVLLKNDGILPLNKNIKNIAVIGPRGNSVRMMYGGYTTPAGLEMSMGGLLKERNIDFGGESDEYFPGSNVKRESEAVTKMVNALLGGATPTIYEAVKAKCPEAQVVFEQGCDIAGTDTDRFAAAAALAKKSEVVLFAAGGKYGWGEPCTSGEGRDTTDIGLPGVQEDLLKALCETGTPVVVIHGDTRPLSSLYAKENANAVLEAWCPGLSGGQAAADVLFGDYNPAGRLPVTTLEHAGQIPIYAAQKTGDLISLDQRHPGFNSFANGIQEPLWCFGEGLSYTTFAYENFAVDAETTANGVIHSSVDITNTGLLDGEEVAQLYFRDEYASMVRPVQQLAGFARVAIKAGETKRVSFTLQTTQTAFLNADRQWAVEAGALTFQVGTSSRDIRQTAVCVIKDSATIDGPSRGFYAEAVIE
jgi:beta-glucosidase